MKKIKVLLMVFISMFLLNFAVPVNASKKINSKELRLHGTWDKSVKATYDSSDNTGYGCRKKTTLKSKSIVIEGKFKIKINGKVKTKKKIEIKLDKNVKFLKDGYDRYINYSAKQAKSILSKKKLAYVYITINKNKVTQIKFND